MLSGRRVWLPRKFSTPGPISTRDSKAERHESSHASVVLDCQDLGSAQSVLHNGEAQQQGTSIASERCILCQLDEAATLQTNGSASVSSLPLIAVIIPNSSRSPTTSSKRPPSNNQCDLEPLLREDDSDSTPSDDEDDADYIDDDVPEAEQRPPASKRRRINLSACSSPTWRETLSSTKIRPREPVQQDLGQATKERQTSPARSEDIYCSAGLRSSFLTTSFEGRLELVRCGSFCRFKCHHSSKQVTAERSVFISFYALLTSSTPALFTRISM